MVMYTMTAFLTCSPFPSRGLLSVGSHSCPQFRIFPNVPAVRVSVRMSAGGENDTQKAQAEENDAENPVKKEDVKEPYPGFFSDMMRMGLSEEQAVAQALKQQKQSNPTRSGKVGGAKNLFKPDGTLYAPWMAGLSADYEPTVIRKRTDASGRLAADPQLAELSGVGMTWKMIGDNLKLSWTTGSEEDCLGFSVSRRTGKSSEWTKVADYRDSPSELKSKGPEGGSYTYVIEDAEPGSWIYRVSDVDVNQNVSDLSQVLVEIESKEDTKLRNIALLALLGFLVVAGFIGLSIDPQS